MTSGFVPFLPQSYLTICSFPHGHRRDYGDLRTATRLQPWCPMQHANLSATYPGLHGHPRGKQILRTQ